MSISDTKLGINTDSTSIMDGDDPVVEELDVCISQTLAQQLYLLQHRTRSVNRTLREPCKADFRPYNQHLSVEYALNQESQHYDKESSSNMQIKTMKFTSDSIPVANCFAIGVRRGEMIHLTPLKGMMEMRPDFSHVEALSTDEVDVDYADDANGDLKSFNETGPQRLVTRVQRRETIRTTAAKKQSFGYADQILQQEPVVPLIINETNSPESQQVVSSLLYTSEQTSNTVGSAELCSTATYMSALNPVGTSSTTDKSELAEADPASLNMAQLAYMPLHTQIEQLMRRCVCLPFARVREFATRARDDGECLHELHKVATLIRGNWVLKSIEWVNHSSDLLGESSVGSGKVNQAARNQAVAARDFVLCQFRHNRTISRPWLARKTKTSRELLREMLQGLGKLKAAQREWEFKFPDDTEFENSYPPIVAAMNEQWSRRETELNHLFEQNDGGTAREWLEEHLRPSDAVLAARARQDGFADDLLREYSDGATNEADTSSAFQHDSHADTEVDSPPQFRRSRSGSLVFGQEDVEEAQNLFRREFHDRGVCSIRHLARLLRTHLPANSSAGYSVSCLDDPTLNAVVKAILLGDQYDRLHLSQPDRTEDEAESPKTDRKIRGSSTPLRIRHRNPQQAPIAIYLGNSATWGDNTPARRERSGSTSSFVAHATDLAHEVYTLSSLDDENLDEFRNVIVDLFRETNGPLKRSEVKDAVKSVTGKEIKQALFNKIMRELAVSDRSQGWLLKSGEYRDSPTAA